MANWPKRHHLPYRITLARWQGPVLFFLLEASGCIALFLHFRDRCYSLCSHVLVFTSFTGISLISRQQRLAHSDSELGSMQRATDREYVAWWRPSRAKTGSSCSARLIHLLSLMRHDQRISSTLIHHYIIRYILIPWSIFIFINLIYVLSRKIIPFFTVHQSSN